MLSTLSRFNDGSGGKERVYVQSALLRVSALGERACLRHPVSGYALASGGFERKARINMHEDHLYGRHPNPPPHSRFWHPPRATLPKPLYSGYCQQPFYDAVCY